VRLSVGLECRGWGDPLLPLGSNIYRLKYPILVSKSSGWGRTDSYDDQLRLPRQPRGVVLV
jgi:hypothetical protein